LIVISNDGDGMVVVVVMTTMMMMMMMMNRISVCNHSSVQETE
jgi:hypothetical protein